MNLTADIEEWIKEKLSKSHSAFNMMPACPYAKRAWTDNKVIIRQCNGLDIYNIMDDDTLLWDDDKEVVVYGFDPSTISADQLSAAVEQANDTYLGVRGLVALEDHPDDPEEVAGVYLNQGAWGLVLLQKRAKLEEAREYLESKGYYKFWNPEYKKEVTGR